MFLITLLIYFLIFLVLSDLINNHWTLNMFYSKHLIYENQKIELLISSTPVLPGRWIKYKILWYSLLRILNVCRNCLDMQRKEPFCFGKQGKDSQGSQITPEWVSQWSFLNGIQSRKNLLKNRFNFVFFFKFILY